MLVTIVALAFALTAIWIRLHHRRYVYSIGIDYGADYVTMVRVRKDPRTGIITVLEATSC